MRGGTLDRRIALQRKSQSLSNTGEPSLTWSTLAQRWSAVRPLNGIERNAASQWVGREQVQFEVRWSEEIEDLSPLDRIICPASEAFVSPVSPRSIYDIIAVNEQGRHKILKIMAARRVA